MTFEVQTTQVLSQPTYVGLIDFDSAHELCGAMGLLSISLIQCKICIHFPVYAFSTCFICVSFIIGGSNAVVMCVSVVLKVWYPWVASRWQVRYLSGMVAGRSRGEDPTWLRQTVRFPV